MRRSMLVFLLLLLLGFSVRSRIVGALPTLNNSECVPTHLGMVDAPMVAIAPSTDENVRSQRSLFKKLFKNFGLEDLFDDNGQSLCVNCCNNNQGNNNGGDYNDNAYSDGEPAAPPALPPPFDPLYSPFPPFAPLQPLPPFGVLPPLPQPFNMLRPIIGGIRGGIRGPSPPVTYKEPASVTYVNPVTTPPPPPPPYVAPLPVPAPEIKYGDAPAPLTTGYSSLPLRGPAPQVIYQPIIFVAPPVKSQTEPLKPYDEVNGDQYLPASTPAPYTPPPIESLPAYPETTDVPPPPPEPYAAPLPPALPSYTAHPPAVDYQSPYPAVTSAPETDPYANTGAKQTSAPYGGITSISATYTIVAPFKAPVTSSYPAAAQAQVPLTAPSCHLQPVQLTYQDQPFRDCPELFTDYQRNRNNIRSVNLIK